MSMLAQLLAQAGARASSAAQRAGSLARSSSHGEDAIHLHGVKELAKTFANYEKENNVAAMLILAEPMAKVGFQKKNIDARIEAARKLNAGQKVFQMIAQQLAPQQVEQPERQPTTPFTYPAEGPPLKAPVAAPSTPTRTPRQERVRDSLLEVSGATLNFKGDLSFSLSRRKEKTLEQLVEERILNSEHRDVIIDTLAKRKLTGQIKIEEVKDDVKGETFFTVFDADGKQIDETAKVKTDLSAKEKEDMAKRLKLTTTISDIDEETGEQVFTKLVGGEETSVERGERVRIPEAEKTTVATKTKLENTIVEGQEVSNRLKTIETDFQDWFVTTPGQVTATFGRKLSRLTGGLVQVAPEYRAEYEAFREATRVNTLLWRKFITGVAGGEKEMRDIEITLPNVDTDDPVSFMAKVKQMQELTDIVTTQAKLSRGDFNFDKDALAKQYPNLFRRKGAVPEGRTKQEVPPAGPETRKLKTLKFDAQGNRIE